MSILEGSTIMIVDDNPGNLSVIFEYLDMLNVEVIVIQEGHEAIHVAELRKPDIILLDIIMPEMDGFEVCRKLKENNKTADIPVIFMSALADMDNIVKGFELGAVDYVVKPVQKEEVIVRMSTHLNMHRAEEEIRKLNSELEERVMERTSQLEASNRELKHEIVMRKHAEQTIAEQRDYLNRIIEGSPVIICEFSSDGIISFINPAGEKITGYTFEEIAGQNWFELFCPPGKYRYFEDLYKEIKQGNVTGFELELTAKNGEKRIISWEIAGRGTDIIGFGNDITERKKSEEEKKKLEHQIYQTEKITALGSLAREIAHDFNNILTGILSYTQIALLNTEENSVTENLNGIINACTRAKELVRHIQTFTHHGEQKHMPVNVNLLLKETLSLIGLTLPDTIKLKYNIDKQSKFIMADSSQIYRMLMNLYTNAIYAMKEKGGVLEISLMDIDVTPEIIHGSLVPGKYVCIIIKDSGCGIDASVINSIFQPYFTTKKAGDGTGLGLSIVHNIVKDYGGEINVESVSGEGTNFYIYFPSIAAEVEAAIKETEKNQTGEFYTFISGRGNLDASPHKPSIS